MPSNDQSTDATYPNTPAGAPLTGENASDRSPAYTQTTHPSTTSHEPGDLGRAAKGSETEEK